jgi:molecular chaperone Hsp33
VQVIGDGPVRSVVVDATDDGDVRGYVGEPSAGSSLPAGRVMLAPIVGRSGVVNIVRDLGLKDRYQGQVALTTGEIDEDIESYLRTSEQVPSALGCELATAGDGKGDVIGCAGILVQALPGGDPASVREVQHALRTGALYDLLVEGVRDARTIAERLLGGHTLEWMGEARAVRFQCRCSPERITDMLRMLTREELAEMIAEGKPAEVTCNFCNAHYLVGTPELERIRGEHGGGGTAGPN